MLDNHDAWEKILALAVPVGGVTLWVSHVLEIRKLRKEIGELERKEVEGKTLIVKPSAAEIERYGRTRRRAASSAAFIGLFVLFASVSVLTLNQRVRKRQWDFQGEISQATRIQEMEKEIAKLGNEFSQQIRLVEEWSKMAQALSYPSETEKHIAELANAYRTNTLTLFAALDMQMAQQRKEAEEAQAAAVRREFALAQNNKQLNEQVLALNERVKAAERSLSGDRQIAEKLRALADLEKRMAVLDRAISGITVSSPTFDDLRRNYDALLQGNKELAKQNDELQTRTRFLEDRYRRLEAELKRVEAFSK